MKRLCVIIGVWVATAQKHWWILYGCTRWLLYSGQLQLSIALTTRVANKETKEKRSRIVDILNEIACTGRFVGICFLIALQRPSAEVLAGELRSNISTKLLGKCDNNLAMLTLDTADAAKLVPQNVPGRFFVNVDGGKVMQGYYFEEHMLMDAPNLTLSVRSFLSKGEGLSVGNSNDQNQ